MTNSTPMTREQAWETAAFALNVLTFDYSEGDDPFELEPKTWPSERDVDDAKAALSFLRTEMERLEGERDEWKARYESINWSSRNWTNALKAAKARAEAAEAQLAQVREALREGHMLVGSMDARMPEQATSDADGWLTSYRIPVGPWHRLLGWAVGTQQLGLEQGDKG